MEVRRINPDEGFLREFRELRSRIQSVETRPTGSVVIRETLTTTDPSTGVSTTIGQLPDGSYGFQPFIGDTEPPPVATAPAVVSNPGSVTVSWDGNFVGGAAMPRDFEHLVVVGHKMTNGTSLVSAELGVIRTVNDTAVITPDFIAIGDTWNFAFKSVDFNGNTSAESDVSPDVVITGAPDESVVNQKLDSLNASVTAAQSAADTAQSAANTAQAAADQAKADAASAANVAGSKGKVIIQSASPASADQLAQNLWIDTTNGANTPKRWDGSSWVVVTDKAATDAANAAANAQTRADQAYSKAVDAATAAGNAQSSADGKNTIWYQTSAPAGSGFKAGDTWFDTDDGNKIYQWNGSTWVAQTLGTSAITNNAIDSTKLATAVTNSITSANNAATAAQATADGKNTAYYQGTQPSGGTYKKGDLWFDTANSSKLYTYSGSAWVLSQDSAGALTVANGKNKSTVSGTAPSSPTTGDIWIDTSNGNVIKLWTGSAWSAYQDTAISSANSAATAAQATANGKNTVYYGGSQPTGGSYKAGDLWFDTANGNKLYTYSGTAWTLTQDSSGALSVANGKNKSTVSGTAPSSPTTGDIWIDTSNGNVIKLWTGSAWTAYQDTAIAAAQTSANGKNTSYYQNTQPSGGTYRAGDLWFDTSNNSKLYTYSGSAWVLTQDSAGALSVANGKNKSTVSGTAPTGATTGDIWIDTSNGNVIKTWNGSSWVISQDAAISAANNAATAAQATANGKNTAYYSPAQPSGGSYKAGDIWFDTANNYRLYTYTGSAWQLAQDSANALSVANGRNASFTQSTAPTAKATGDIWIDTANGNLIKTWNGTAWVAVQDTAIAAAQTAANNAQTSANGKNLITYSTNAASGNGTTAGDTWFQINGSGNVIGMWQWTGSAWTAKTVDGAVTANLDAGKITVGILNAARIGATSIDATKLAAGSITATAIAASAITATAIAANAIAVGTAAIQAGAITNAMIKDADIQSAKIYSLDAGKITTGTLDANRIGANTITATKLFLGDMTNLAADGNFTDTTKANWSGGGSIVTSTTEPNKLTVVTASSGNNDIQNKNTFQVTPGDKIYAEVEIYGEPANVGGGTPNINLVVKDDANNMSWPQFASTTRAAVSGQWYKLSGVVTIPANARTATFEMSVGFSADAVGNTYYWRRAVVRRMATGALIVDGSITGTKIAAGSITASGAQIADATISTAQILSIDAAKITTGTLAANIIGAGSIDATKLAANSITATAIKANAITTTAIASQAITADQLAANSVTATAIKAGSITASSGIIANIDASVITAGTLGANIIGAQSITADKLAANSITATAIKANAITTSAIASQAITADQLAANSVTATAIKAGSITASSGIIANIDASVITAGTLSSNVIASSSITADKLLISDFTNLATGGGFDSALDLNNWNSNARFTIATTGMATGTGCLQAASGSGVAQLIFKSYPDVTSGEKYFIALKFKSTSDWNGTAGNSKLRIGDQNGALITAISPTVNTSWTDYSTVVTIPSTMTGMQIQISADNTAGTAWYDQVQIRRMNGGELLVDGSVTAKTIAASSINASHLMADAVTATAIKAGSITASSGIIASLDASKISTGSMSGSFIAAKTLTADKVVIASSDNMIVEGDFSANGSSWELPSGFSINATAGRNSLPALAIVNNGSLQTSFNAVGAPTKVAIENLVTDTSVYKISSYAKSTTSIPASGVLVNARFKSSTGSYTTLSVPISATAANTWQQIVGFVQAPVNTISVAFSVSSAASMSSGTTYIDSVQVTRAGAADLIVDGAITGNKLTGNAIDGKTITGATIIGGEVKTDTANGTVIARMGPGAVSPSGTSRPGIGFTKVGITGNAGGLYSDDGYAVTLAQGFDTGGASGNAVLTVGGDKSILYGYQEARLDSRTQSNIFSQGSIQLQAQSIALNAQTSFGVQVNGRQAFVPRIVGMTSGRSTYPFSNADWGPGTMTINAAPSTQNNDFLNVSQDGFTTTKDGLYYMQCIFAGQAGKPPNGEMLIWDATNSRVLASDDLGRTTSWNPQLTGTAFIPMSTQIKFLTKNRSASYDNIAYVTIACLA